MGIRWDDPTHGRIDKDIQEYVDDMEPKSLGQRVAMENTLQNRRAEHQGHAGHKCDLPGRWVRILKGLVDGSVLTCTKCGATRRLMNGKWILEA